MFRMNNNSDIEDVISIESLAKLALLSYSLIETKLHLPESLRKEEL